MLNHYLYRVDSRRAYKVTSQNNNCLYASLSTIFYGHSDFTYYFRLATYATGVANCNTIVETVSIYCTVLYYCKRLLKTSYNVTLHPSV